MDFISNNSVTLGILGGGQLGKMMLLSTANYDIRTKVLDPDPECASAQYCTEFVQGSFADYETVINFGQNCQFLTVEIEHVNTDALRALRAQGVQVHPDPDALDIIKDKGLQKNFYLKNQIPSSAFVLIDKHSEVEELLANGKITFPFVQKTRTAGYDGKGVKVIKSREELSQMLPGPSVIETAVNIKKELAVIVAQSDAQQGVVAFDVVDMEFNKEANLVEFLYCPAAVSDEIQKQALALAKKTLKAYNIRGLLAVEMFLDQEDKIWVNEVAPRPHNSGHHTIDAAFTSQFEQHWRSVMNLPLGDTRIHTPAVMVNILGEPGYEGQVKYEGWEKLMACEGLKLHIYGKKKTKSYRKMGHFTVLAPQIEVAIERARQIKDQLKVKA